MKRVNQTRRSYQDTRTRIPSPARIKVRNIPRAAFVYTCSSTSESKAPLTANATRTAKELC